MAYRIPKVDKSLLKFLDNNMTEMDPSTQINAAIYCSFIEAMKEECYTKSILELWNFNKKKIESLTKEDIVHAVQQSGSKVRRYIFFNSPCAWSNSLPSHYFIINIFQFYLEN